MRRLSSTRLEQCRSERIRTAKLCARGDGGCPGRWAGEHPVDSSTFGTRSPLSRMISAAPAVNDDDDDDLGSPYIGAGVGLMGPMATAARTCRRVTCAQDLALDATDDGRVAKAHHGATLGMAQRSCMDRRSSKVMHVSAVGSTSGRRRRGWG